LKGLFGDKFTRTTGHDHLHHSALFFEATYQVGAFISGNAAGHAQQNLATGILGVHAVALSPSLALTSNQWMVMY
jgi:hypothetical protein